MGNSFLTDYLLGGRVALLLDSLVRGRGREALLLSSFVTGHFYTPYLQAWQGSFVALLDLINSGTTVAL